MAKTRSTILDISKQLVDSARAPGMLEDVLSYIHYNVTVCMNYSNQRAQIICRQKEGTNLAEHIANQLCPLHPCSAAQGHLGQGQALQMPSPYFKGSEFSIMLAFSDFPIL